MLPPVLRNKRHISPKKKEKKIKSCAIKKCGHTYMVTEEAIFQKHVQKRRGPNSCDSHSDVCNCKVTNSDS